MISARAHLWLVFGVLALLTAAVLAGAPWLHATYALPLWAVGGGAVLALVALQALAFALLDWSWVRPTTALEREIRLVLHANAGRAIARPRWHGLGGLPDAIATLAEHWRRGRAEQEAALARATARLDEQQSRLGAILRQLSDGIVACATDRRILLFNDAAADLFRGHPELGLDRSLDRLIAREPIAHAFALLCDRLAEAGATRAAGAREEFVCATVDGARLLRCRMVLIIGPDEAASGFILDFADATERLGRIERREARVVGLIQALRPPVAALRAAAEVLAVEDEQLTAADRRAFVEVMERESEALSDRLHALSSAATGLAGGDWPMADLFSADLVRAVNRRLASSGTGLHLNTVGSGLWLRGDGYHLTLLLASLVQRLARACGGDAFDLETHVGERVRLDLVWPGGPLSPALLERWLDEPLIDGSGKLRLRDVLTRHDGELWSQVHFRPGHALLRLPLPPPNRPQIGRRRAVEPLPPRPEFFDFDLLARGEERAKPMLQQPLAELSYVVFDTETTGLEPQRDRIIQLAGVRIVNRRLLSGETFDRLVDPGRPIPTASTRFHGITDDMVRGRPPIQIVLPQFHAFARDAVLVAHNAAFDMAFLQRAEESAAVHFENPVLDTLLLSAVLHDHTTQHSLDAIAARFGITMVDRHKALGDAIGTAQLFLRLLDLLGAQGVRTLGDAVALSERAVAIRRRQQQQFGDAGSQGGVQVAERPEVG